MKQNLTKFFNLIKKDKQAKTLTIVSVLLLFIFTIGYSLSAFTGSKSTTLANIKVNDLSFNITTNSGESDDRVLHLQAGKTESFNVVITNLNKIDTKYELIYEICSDSNCTSTSKEIPETIFVKKESTNTEINGTINKNNSKEVVIITTNASTNDYYIKIGLNAGYSWNELELVNQISAYDSEKTTQIIAYVDGIEVSSFPDTCNYIAEIKGYNGNTEVELKNASVTCDFTTKEWATYYIGHASKIVVNFKYKTYPRIIEYIFKLDKNENGLEVDDTADKNLRYVGPNPKNYVQFGNDGELWRIIGIFDVKDIETGSTTKKIKIMRNDSLGNFSWDARYNNQLNDYYGINAWNISDLQKELNGDYLNYNLTSNKNWYNSYWNGITPVQRQTGVFNYNYTVKEKYQNLISESIWNTGANEYTIVNSAATIPTLGQYNAERGNKFYTADTANNVTRTFTWTGKVGLIYASDFGYASTDEECQKDLRAGQVYNVGNNTYDYTNVKCKNNNWLYKSQWYWTLSPYSDSLSVFYIHGNGFVHADGAYFSFGVHPAVYLKSETFLVKGTGTESNPYIIE